MKKYIVLVGLLVLGTAHAMHQHATLADFWQALIQYTETSGKAHEQAYTMLMTKYKDLDKVDQQEAREALSSSGIELLGNPVVPAAKTTAVKQPVTPYESEYERPRGKSSEFNAFFDQLGLWEKSKNQANFSKVIVLLNRISELPEKELATSLMQGFLHREDPTSKVFKDADQALARYHAEQLAIQRNVLNNIEQQGHKMATELNGLTSRSVFLKQEQDRLTQENGQLTTQLQELQTQQEQLAKVQQAQGAGDDVAVIETENTELNKRAAALKKEIELLKETLQKLTKTKK